MTQAASSAPLPAVARLRRIVIVTADLAAAEHFFAEAFAFETVSRAGEDPSLPVLLGTPEASTRQTIMRLGEQEIGVIAFDPPGRAYPAGGNATDLWFQHFAIIVADMDAAYARLQQVGRYLPISQGGPQRLPPSSGSVSAFKFRDAEGHPLELLAFPEEGRPPYWSAKAADALFLGIDHSAMAVSNTARSVAFYEQCFGLSLAEQTENSGPEQARLDGQPGATVTVTGLKPAQTATPHVELLGYRMGTRRPIADATTARDLAATFFLLEAEGAAAGVEALTAAGARFGSPGVVTLADGRPAVAVLDPDGHRIVIAEA